MAEQGEGLTPEQLVEEFRRMKVSDLLLSTLYTLSQLAYGKLEPSARDLDGARLAIDGIRALLPVLETSLPAEATRDFQQVLVNLQLAYASAASDARTAPTRGQTPGPVPSGDEPAPAAAGGGEGVEPESSAGDETRGQTPGQGPEGDGER